jgi:hypothetical protein
MNPLSQRLAILAILAVAPVAGEAATYSVTPVFAGAFTNDGTFTPIPNYDYGSRQPAILQFDFLVSTSGFAADQYGFANGVFTITPRPIVTNTSVPGWNPSHIPNVDSNGALPGGVVPLLADNADLAAQDLKDILIGVATPLTTNPAVDPRFRFGQGITANFNVGSAYFDYNGGYVGFGGEFVTARFTQASALYLDGTTNRYIGIVDYVYEPPVYPEPTTCLMAAIGMVCTALRRH